MRSILLKSAYSIHGPIQAPLLSKQQEPPNPGNGRQGDRERRNGPKGSVQSFVYLLRTQHTSGGAARAADHGEVEAVLGGEAGGGEVHSEHASGGGEGNIRTVVLDRGNIL